MLTAVIRADGSPRALAATLAVLIPAVAEGLLGHAVIVDTVGAPDFERVADTTGAHYLRTSWAEAWEGGAAAARGDRLVLFEAGDVPQAHWALVVERHLLVTPDIPALIPLHAVAAALRERAAISLAGRRLRSGLVLPKVMVLEGRLDQAPQRLPVWRERTA